MDYYYSIQEEVRYEEKIKGSKFIASAFPIDNSEEAEKIIKNMQKEFYDATHNCFAYKLGPKGLEYKVNDDGEPSGTAGNPILFAINKFKLSDILVVVTRFYGGTKLGKGGLARAYGGVTEEVIKTCVRRQIDITVPIQVFTTYDDISIIKKLVDDFAVTYDETYTDTVEIIANIPRSKAKEFQQQITDKTADRSGSRVLE